MAALSMSSLLFNIPAVNLRLKSPSYPSLSAAHFPSSKTHTKPLSIITRRISSPISASFNGSAHEFDNQPDEGFETNNEQEEVMEIKKAAPKRLKKDAGRLYVGNLPFSTTSNELMDLFSQAGTVVYAEVIYDRVTDRSRGFAFVNMISSEEAEKAIQMFNQSLLKGRAIQVNFPEVPRGAERDINSVIEGRRPSLGYIDTAHKLYAGNLGWNVTSEALKNAFGHLGGLLGAKVVFDRDTGRSRGYGFVTFASKEEASAALESMNGMAISSIRYVDTAHKLCVGNLGWNVTSEALKNAFGHLGGLLGAKVVFDRDTGRSRGYGFVTFTSEEEASAALESMNGAEVEGRPLRLSYATDHRRQTGTLQSSNETPTDMQESSNETPTDMQEISSETPTDMQESTNESSTDMQESTVEMESSVSI